MLRRFAPRMRQRRWAMQHFVEAIAAVCSPGLRYNSLVVRVRFEYECNDKTLHSGKTRRMVNLPREPIRVKVSSRFNTIILLVMTKQLESILRFSLFQRF